MRHFITLGSESFDDFVERLCYIVGSLVALIGLMIVIWSILDMRSEPRGPSLVVDDKVYYMGGDKDENIMYFVRGVQLIVLGIVIFTSGVYGIPIMSYTYGIYDYASSKPIRMFYLLFGLIIITFFIIFAISALFKFLSPDTVYITGFCSGTDCSYAISEPIGD